MRKHYLVLIAVSTAIFVFVAAGCNRKPKAESQADQPAATEQTEQKAEETTPAMEHPDSGKPKDHPAH